MLGHIINGLRYMYIVIIPLNSKILS